MKLIALSAEEREHSLETALDEALAMTFPASDPVSISADECIGDEIDSESQSHNHSDNNVKDQTASSDWLLLETLTMNARMLFASIVPPTAFTTRRF